MKPLIECIHADFGYDNQDAVKDVTFTIEPGDYIAVVGENGAGKSTLVKGLLGLIKPLAGDIRVSEELKRSGIGYLPQQTAAQKDFPATVYEVALSGCLSRRGNRPFYSRSEKALVRDNLKRLGILELSGVCYRDLSGGQQQRALIARALCATDQLLILDEPTTGLDPASAKEFYQMVGRLNQEDHAAILMVSHDIKNIVAEADKILHLKKDVLFYGSTKDYQNSQTGRKFLGGVQCQLC